MTPASVIKRVKANGASLMSDVHNASLEMAWLRLCRITHESTESENCYSSLNRELRWLWNSVYKSGTHRESSTWASKHENKLMQFKICCLILTYFNCFTCQIEPFGRSARVRFKRYCYLFCLSRLQY